MKIVKKLYLERNGTVTPVTLTIDTPGSLDAAFVDVRALLMTAAQGQDVTIFSRHDKGNSTKIRHSLTQAQPNEQPKLKLVA